MLGNICTKTFLPKKHVWQNRNLVGRKALVKLAVQNMRATAGVHLSPRSWRWSGSGTVWGVWRDCTASCSSVCTTDSGGHPWPRSAAVCCCCIETRKERNRVWSQLLRSDRLADLWRGIHIPLPLLRRSESTCSGLHKSHRVSHFDLGTPLFRCHTSSVVFGSFYLT